MMSPKSFTPLQPRDLISRFSHLAVALGDKKGPFIYFWDARDGENWCATLGKGGLEVSKR